MPSSLFMDGDDYDLDFGAVAQQTWIEAGRPDASCCKCGNTDGLSLVIPYCLDDEACHERRAGPAPEGEH